MDNENSGERSTRVGRSERRGGRRRISQRLRWVQWLSAAVALLIAVFIIVNNREHRAAVAEQVRERNILTMEAAKKEIEAYVGDILLCVRLMSLHPSVLDLNDRSRAYLQSLFEANYGQHQLAEIYLIKRGFDGSHHPYMSFDKVNGAEGEEEEGEDVHSLEREAAEYAVHVEQLGLFAADPGLEFLISDPVPLCVGEAGNVYSAPIRSDGELTGIVAGMVPSNIVSKILERGGLGNAVLLANESGSMVGCTGFPSALDSWFRERFAEEGVADFFEGRGHVFRADTYVGLWTPVDIPDDRNWYISFAYDEERALRAAGVSSVHAVWGTIAVVLLLGAGVVVMWRVIAALLAARQESDARARALAEAEAQTRAIVGTAAEGIITIDERGVIESFNAAAERTFGFAAAEVIGENVSMLMPPPDRDRHDQYLARYLQNGGGWVLSRVRELRGRHKDGTVFPMELAVSDVRVGDRRLFAGIVRDVHERKQAEEQARQRQAALAHVTRLGTMAEMAATLAHELNQPLFAIVNYVEACLERTSAGNSDPAEVLHDMERAAVQAKRAADIVERIRRFIRKPEPKREWIDLNALVREAAELLQCESPSNGTLLRLDLDETLPPVLAEPIQIEQVVVNLMRNALEALKTPGLAERRLLVCTIKTAGDAVELAVEDTGPGLGGPALEDVFEPFFTTKSDGLGMGLSISRSIIEGHNGRLWATPNPIRGTTFRFTLPVHGGDVAHE